MMRTACLLGILALTAPVRLPAQERDSVPRVPSHADSKSRAAGGVKRATVHWGKWLAAGAAAALTVMGAHEHANSNREFDRLLDICHAHPADCELGPGGTYLNPTAEQSYQASIRYDRRARTRLLAGQATLLAAAALFIADLRHRPGGPENKPFSPLDVAGDVRTGSARVRLRLTF
ncbi:MAG: hypothetical protein ACREMM_09515 [Gemmatimonadales bacterium]